jgi:transcriptional regulator with XRE-family HTH domain
MSQRDRRLLELSGLSQTSIASVLKKSRQAIQKGVDGDRHYLNSERVRALYAGLLPRKTEESKALLKAIKEEAPEIEMYLADLSGQTLYEADNPFDQFEFEAWIFSNEPMELERVDFLNMMKDRYFSDPNLRWAYFMPPGTNCQKMCKLMEHTVQEFRAEKKEHAEIAIVESNGLWLVPHMIIFDVTVTSPEHEPRGYIRRSRSPSQFIELPQEEIASLLSCVKTSGIGMSKDQLIPAGSNAGDLLESAFEGLTFRIVFYSGFNE